MKKTRNTEKQIAYAFLQAETGTPVGEVSHRMGELLFVLGPNIMSGLGFLYHFQN